MTTLHREFSLFIFIAINVFSISIANELPCDFSQSDDISQGILNSNRSITFNGQLYEYGLYSMINYTIINDEKIYVEPYARACIYDDRLPCKFSESINITDSVSDENGLIVFDHMEFPKGTYATVAYTLQITNKDDFDEFTRKPTSKYVRGCVCNRKSCIRFCCSTPYHLYIDGKCIANDEDKNVNVPIRDSNNVMKHVNFKDHFYYVTKKACGGFVNGENELEINQAGHVISGNRKRNHEKYCLVIEKDQITQEKIARKLNCIEVEEIEMKTKFKILPYCMLISLPFIFASIVIYVIYRKLRNVYGKCLICYLTGLLIGLTFLMITQFYGSMGNNNPLLCKFIGYTIYASFCCAFLWLNVISFDLWFCFSGFRKSQSDGRFYAYSIYAFGITLIVLLIALLLDNYAEQGSILKPGIGLTSCYLQESMISQMIFFYLPLVIILIVNCAFFFLTARSISRCQKETKKITSNEESSKHKQNLNDRKSNYTLFLRLFIIMGVFWIMEAISFFIARDSLWFLISDIANVSQGVLIFITVVLNRTVKSLLTQSWRKYFGKPAIKNGSSETHSSNLSTKSHKLANTRF